MGLHPFIHELSLFLLCTLTLHLHSPRLPPESIPPDAIDTYMAALQAEGLLVPTAQEDCYQVGSRL